jgi:hypothetical protein
MADQTNTQPETTKNRIFEILRKAFLFGALGVLLYTIYRMAGRKFGWF